MRRKSNTCSKVNPDDGRCLFQHNRRDWQEDLLVLAGVAQERGLKRNLNEQGGEEVGEVEG